MTALPWQNLKASEEIIVIFDAAHAVEQEELERFLRAALQDHGIDSTLHECVVPIVRDPEDPPEVPDAAW